MVAIQYGRSVGESDQFKISGIGKVEVVFGMGLRIRSSLDWRALLGLVSVAVGRP